MDHIRAELHSIFILFSLPYDNNRHLRVCVPENEIKSFYINYMSCFEFLIAFKTPQQQLHKPRYSAIFQISDFSIESNR